MKQFRGISWCGGTIVGSLFRYGVGIVRCLFNLLYYVIWWLHQFSSPRNCNLVGINLWKCDTDKSYQMKTILGVFLAVVETIVGFSFVLCCGYCSVSFQSFVLRHLVMAPVSITKKLQFSRNKSMKKPPKLLGSISSYLEWPRLCFN